MSRVTFQLPIASIFTSLVVYVEVDRPGRKRECKNGEGGACMSIRPIFDFGKKSSATFPPLGRFTSACVFSARLVASAAAILADVEKQGIPVAGARSRGCSLWTVDVDRYAAASVATVEDRVLDVLAEV